jgi:hypothetical protein
MFNGFKWQKCESITFTAAQVRDERDVKDIASHLPEKGNHIYWFEVSNPEPLLRAFGKRDLSINYKIVRDNKGVDSKCVYVGSCTKTKLKDRFKQHCGWGNIHTYSLQLKHWLDDADLKVTFSYVKLADATVTTQLEDQLHIEMKPLFGKSGANNKITKG